MFKPRYIISNKLLSNIAQISALKAEMNTKRYPATVLYQFEKEANELSTFSSTSIEGNPLALTEVKKVLKASPVNARDSEREVLNYNTILEELNKGIADTTLSFNEQLILHIQKSITHDLLPSFQTGVYRTDPVVIHDPRTRNVVYMPPNVEEVPELMKDLVSYILDNQKSIDALILAGIFHKQFVIIHPFMDGNGRTARLVTKVLLAHMGLNTFNLFSFENYYNRNISKYFQQVGEFGDYYELVSAIDFTSWLEYFTDGIIDELLRVQKELETKVFSPENELKDYHTTIIETIRSRGFITDHEYAQVTDRAKATRALDFQKLMELDMIERKAKGKSTYYVLKE